MRSIGVITTSRADYGIIRPVLKRILADAELELMLLVTGTHLLSEFGNTVDEIENDGFEIAEKVQMPLPSDLPESIAEAMGEVTSRFGKVYARRQPDILVAMGDRFEMHAAVVASLPFAIPIAHIHGGESTEGAIDEALRHSLTKMAHLHFAATETYAKRIVQMGEEPWRVITSGAPGLDNLDLIELLSKDELEDKLGLDMPSPPLMVTFHPVTLEADSTLTHIEELLAALMKSQAGIVISSPNADAHHKDIVEQMGRFAADRSNVVCVTSMGTRLYFSLMNYAAAMVGNSSSGIVEAASFKLPVVNIGNRQRGRICGQNVIHTPCERDAIASAIETAISEEFRASLCGLENPYGKGNASKIIVSRLKKVELGKDLLLKRFWDSGKKT